MSDVSFLWGKVGERIFDLFYAEAVAAPTKHHHKTNTEGLRYLSFTPKFEDCNLF